MLHHLREVSISSLSSFPGIALIRGSLPISFYLKLFGDEMSPREKLGQYVLLTVSIAISVVGTIWSFLPKSLIV